MAAPGFYQPICFNPALVYLIAGFLIGLSLTYYLDKRSKKGSYAPSAPAPRLKRKRR